MTKVTIVDDSMDYRNALKALLIDIGGVKIISEAENGSELFRKIKNNRPNIIFMDIEMPYINGFEATENITSLYPEIKVIGMSSYIKDNFVHKLINAGAKGYLIKSGDNYKKIKELLTAENENFIFSPEINHLKSLYKLDKTILIISKPEDYNLNEISNIKKAGYNILKAQNITETTFLFNQHKINGLIIDYNVIEKKPKFIERILYMNTNPNLKIFIINKSQGSLETIKKRTAKIYNLKNEINHKIILEKIEKQ